MQKEKTVVIGAGPAGSSCAIYLARFCHSVVVVDAGGDVPGRTKMATSLENFITNYPAGNGKEIIRTIHEQLAHFGVDLIRDRVVLVKKNNDTFTVDTEKGSIEADFVVVAVGVEDRMPPIAIPDEYYDFSIFHCPACDWYRMRHKQIALIGNSDHAVQEALIFQFMNPDPSPIVIPADSSAKFSREMLDKSQKNNITIYYNPIRRLVGLLGHLKAIELQSGERVAAEAIFTILGHNRRDHFLDDGGIDVRRDSEGFIRVDYRTFETSVKNLYAVGPCNDGPDQAIIAGGQGALAALAIHRKILEKNEL
ncbi:MAG TPA: NAD(P)/FAD-dependent oxidoreductase [bacterium]|nr:NAD(P)/FAD-dependent oxidoreductase [bacterium]